MIPGSRAAIDQHGAFTLPPIELPIAVWEIAPGVRLQQHPARRHAVARQRNTDIAALTGEALNACVTPVCAYTRKSSLTMLLRLATLNGQPCKDLRQLGKAGMPRREEPISLSRSLSRYPVSWRAVCV